MKTLITPLLVLILTLALATTSSSLDAVRDTDGHEVKVGQQYYILAATNTRGGGLTINHKNIYSDNCSEVHAAQSRQSSERGIPVTFHPASPNDRTIRISTDLNVQVSYELCPQRTAWKLDSVDKASGRRYVTLGGRIGKPGPATLSNWFKIETLHPKLYFYKISYCPTVCQSCRPECGNVGVFDEMGWLELNTHMFMVMFERVVGSDNGQSTSL